MPILQRASIFATGSAIIDNLHQTAATITRSAGSAADLVDGSNSTGGYIDASGNSASGTYLEEWTLDTSGMTTEDIYSLKFIITCIQVNISGTATGAVQLSINGAADETIVVPSTDASTFSVESFLDPDDSNPWTKDKIDAQTFGWYLGLTNAGSGSPHTRVWVTNFYVEVRVNEATYIYNTQAAAEIQEVPHFVQPNLTPPGHWAKMNRQWMGIRQKRGRR